MHRICAPALVLFVAAVASSTANGRFFVSPTGQDTNPGTNARPFATIQRAQHAIRERKKRGPLTEPVTVNIRGGVYRLDRPLVFTPEDSGTELSPVTYLAAPGEKVVLSGGRRIDTWVRTGDVWTATLPAVKAGTWHFTQLYVNGRRRPRARTPKEGHYFRVESALSEKSEAHRGFRFSADDVQNWPDLHEAVFVVLGSWYNTIHHVRNIDMATRTVHFTNRAGRPFSWYEKNLRYYVENVAGALDQPGEWHLDTTTGMLSYRPLPEETLDTTQIVAPVVKQTLVQLHGEPGTERHVEHLQLVGLEMRHTDAHLPSDLFDARQAATVQSAGILADGARHCTVARCTVANMGEHGIWFRDDCQHNTVRECHVHDLGGGGIYVGENWRWGRDTPGWRGYTDHSEIPHVTEHNTIDNNFVHNGCHVFTGAVGIWVGQASYTTISHNAIQDMSYSGISVGWDWSGRTSTSHHNLITHNHIHHIGHGRMNDLAGIYTLGRSPGTILRNNLIHDVHAYQSSAAYCLGAGIYLDQSSGHIRVEYNVCHHIDNAGIFLHYGIDNTIHNNVFTNLRGLSRHGWGLHLTARDSQRDHGNVATRNIVCAPTGKAAKIVEKESTEGTPPGAFVAVNQNLYWPGAEHPARFSISHHDNVDGILDVERWKALGQDPDSLIADPAFANPAAHDYRLTADSPAHALGITSIDTADVGLYGDPEWTRLPGTVSMRPLDPPSVFTPKQLLVLREDYEDWPSGYVPANTQFTDRQKGAMIEVTDEEAAEGAKSLRFSDAPGLEQPYYPNRVWNRLRFAEGAVRVSFDFMNHADRAATFWVELRDWTGPDLKAGPTLTFTPDGTLQLTGDQRLPCLPGRWYHVSIEFDLGDEALKQYTLRFGPRDDVRKSYTVPFADADFRVLTWLGFVALDRDRHSVAYIDNLDIVME